MFGRRNRKQLQALEGIHEQISAADFRARAVLNDAIAEIDLRLAREREDRERLQLSTQTAIENAQSLSTAQATELGRLLLQVANTCATVAERLEEDRVERQALAEWITRLDPSSVPPLESRERALGGTVFPAPEITAGSDLPAAEHEIDLRDPAEPPVGAEDASAEDHRWTYGQPAAEHSPGQHSTWAPKYD